MADSGLIEGGQDNSILEDFWPTFNVDTTLPVVECSTRGSLAVDVLETYGIPNQGGGGGPLADIDIKRSDALTVIKQSLLEDITEGKLKEPMVNETGQVEFVTIGGASNISDIYYTVQTANYVEPAAGVMVTAARPLPTRKVIEWKPIWGEGGPAIYSYQDMLENCHKEDFNRYASIVFNDPNLDSTYEDGIDNLFEIVEPFERIIGYVVYRKPPTEFVQDNKDYAIDYTNQATIPVRAGVLAGAGGAGLTSEDADLGSELQLLPKIPQGDSEECWTGAGQGIGADFSKGVEIVIREDLRFDTVRETTIDKFVRVSGVFVIGKEILMLHAAPATPADAIAEGVLSPNQVRIWASIDDNTSKTFQLREGYQYAIGYEPGQEFGNPYIVFSKDVHPKDEGLYGTLTPFYLDPFCDAAADARYDSITEYTGSILPVNKNKGILVEQIWATVELTTPSVQIKDPQGHALDIAEGLIYQLGAMTVEEKPAPVGYAGDGATGGTVVDQEDAIQDHDPTTAQPLSDTEMDRFLDNMQGGGMALTLSFLDEDNVAEVAKQIYEYMQTGEGVHTVHTCGPDCNPSLGGQGVNGIVNSIQYSYSDKGSYTISVQEGPFLVGGLAAVDGGPSQKMVEDFGFNGTVIQDAGNGILFKIRIDGYGERWAVNTCHQVIRVGDRVGGTIHNNPVEA